MWNRGPVPGVDASIRLTSPVAMKKTLVLSVVLVV